MSTVATSSSRVVIVNCLPATLGHYQHELLSVLDGASPNRQVILRREVADQIGSTRSKIIRAGAIVWNRLTGYLNSNADIIVVVWPLFGFLDIITWSLAARKNHVIIIYHDPRPLRRQVGTSRMYSLLFRQLSRIFGVEALCHTYAAKEALFDATGVSALVAPHPILAPDAERLQTAQERQIENGTATVIVLGQYKPARSLQPLIEIAQLSSANYRLQIFGRGWPDIPGWEVVDSFLSEQDFTEQLMRSTCVVIPYSRFFQSGVAVRCAEAGVPVVAPRHEHIMQIYGERWPGLVDENRNWISSVENICNRDRAPINTQKAFVEATKGWSAVLAKLTGVDR
jgi:hypothetical protein